jgi:hypothetical protein
MAKRTVLVSDRSGDVIEDGKGATLRVTYQDARKGSSTSLMPTRSRLLSPCSR